MTVNLGGLSDMKILDTAMAEADMKGVRVYRNGLYNLNS